MKELVSVIIPAYNAENTIKRAINSVLKQTYPNIEVIVVNDGSSDSTLKVCNTLANQDYRIVVIHKSNGGVSSARNSALDCCKGKYIMFLDSDDWYESEMVEKMLNAMVKNSSDLVCCGYNIWNENGINYLKRTLRKETWRISALDSAIGELQNQKCLNALWNKIFKATIINKNSLRMDISVDMGEDLLYIIDYLQYCNGDVMSVNDCYYNYLISSNGLQSKAREDNFQRRISQLDGLHLLFDKHYLPKDVIYIEMLRICYLSVLELTEEKFTIKTKNVISEIIHSKSYEMLVNSDFKCPSKFKIFKKVLLLKHEKVIFYAVSMLNTIQKLRGKSVIWNNNY